jgi:hypothetical protein
MRSSVTSASPLAHRLPVTTARRTRVAALCGVLALAGACADGTRPNLLAPPEVVVSTGATGTPGAFTAQALVGRWTRLDASGTSEVTFAFQSDGTGSRTTVQRTPLGASIAVDQQPFRWSAGAGVLILTFPGPGTLGSQTIVRASFRVEQALTGTVLVLDGLGYGRAVS